MDENNPHDPIRLKIWGVFKQAQASGDITSISKYAADNELEFFAECFSARAHGEKMPDYMLDMVETVTKMSGGKG